MLGGICLCLTSLLFLVDFFVSDSARVGLQRFSDESYNEVMMMGMEDCLEIGTSTELELDDLKLGIGIEISLKSLTPSSQ